MAAKLANKTKDAPAARGAIRQLLGESIFVHEKAGELHAEVAGLPMQIDMVAGAGFEPATSGL